MRPPGKCRWQPGDWGVQNPGMFHVDDEMLRRLRPDCYTTFARVLQALADVIRLQTARDLIKEHMWLGSIQAAYVMSLKPGRVAAYSDMLDCVAMLDYPPRLLRDFGFERGARLLTVNYYDARGKDADIEFGPRKCSDWTGFQPIIADFVSDDVDRLEERKAALPRSAWERAWELAVEYEENWPDSFRSGEPYARVPKTAGGRVRRGR